MNFKEQKLAFQLPQKQFFFRQTIKIVSYKSNIKEWRQLQSDIISEGNTFNITKFSFHKNREIRQKKTSKHENFSSFFGGNNKIQKVFQKISMLSIFNSLKNKKQFISIKYSKDTTQQLCNESQQSQIDVIFQQQNKNKMKEKFCLNSVASFQDINSSSLNKSRTKQTYSFSRTQRFEQNKPLCGKSTYGGDFIQHKIQGAGIGYGMRSDFTKSFGNTPSGAKYNLCSGFDENQKMKKGNTMGNSRDKIVFNQYINREKLKFPPSTKYEYERVEKYRSPSFTLRSRTKIQERSMTLDPETKNPGPGTYKGADAPKVSKFNKISYSTSRSKRFSSDDNKVPGVGKYEQMVNISGSGKYANAKYRGGTQAKFNKSRRITYFDKAIQSQSQKPGPGFYKAPSQFGQYDGDVYLDASRIRGRK